MDWGWGQDMRGRNGDGTRSAGMGTVLLERGGDGNEQLSPLQLQLTNLEAR